MAGQLLGPPELDPPAPHRLNVEERIGLWMQLVDLGTELLLAGLRNEVGPKGDWKSAYRAWYKSHMKEHDITMQRMLEELGRREANCDR